MKPKRRDHSKCRALAKRPSNKRRQSWKDKPAWSVAWFARDTLDDGDDRPSIIVRVVRAITPTAAAAKAYKEISLGDELVLNGTLELIGLGHIWRGDFGGWRSVEWKLEWAQTAARALGVPCMDKPLHGGLKEAKF